MIILHQSQGLDGSKEVDGKKQRDYWRSHQVPLRRWRNKPEHVLLLEEWMKSYKPEEAFNRQAD